MDIGLDSRCRRKRVLLLLLINNPFENTKNVSKIRYKKENGVTTNPGSEQEQNYYYYYYQLV